MQEWRKRLLALMITGSLIGLVVLYVLTHKTWHQELFLLCAIFFFVSAIATWRYRKVLTTKVIAAHLSMGGVILFVITGVLSLTAAMID